MTRAQRLSASDIATRPRENYQYPSVRVLNASRHRISLRTSIQMHCPFVSRVLNASRHRISLRHLFEKKKITGPPPVLNASRHRISLRFPCPTPGSRSPQVLNASRHRISLRNVPNPEWLIQKSAQRLSASDIATLSTFWPVLNLFLCSTPLGIGYRYALSIKARLGYQTGAQRLSASDIATPLPLLPAVL